MASNTLKTRIALAAKTLADWNSTTTIPLLGEVCLEISTDSSGNSQASKWKVGDGVSTYAKLPYSSMTPDEIQVLIDSSAYTLPTATSTTLGGVKIGTNISVSDGVISVANGTTSAKGVVQLTNSTSSTSTTTAATPASVKSAYDLATTANTAAATAQSAADKAQTAADAAQSTADGKVSSVSLASGTNNGTVKLTVDGTTTDNIAVTGLGTAAYTSTTAYATAAQGTKADNAMPKSGGTFTGAVTLYSDPTTNLGAATKQYVDAQLTSKIAASDAMVFKGTLGTNGTVTAVPTTGVVAGDTYKVITAGTWAGSTCKVGDMLIALNSGSVTADTTNWAYIPSGDEAVTTIQYSTTTQNLTTSAQTGTITVGEAATKQVDTTISAASTSTKLPTSQAVATFVEGKGYVTTDKNVTNTLATTTKAYVTGTTSATTNTGTQVFDTGVYLDTTAGMLTATTFKGALQGNATTATSATSATSATTATKFASAQSVALTGQVTGTASSTAGWSVATTVAECSTDVLKQGSNTLVLDGNF